MIQQDFGPLCTYKPLFITVPLPEEAVVTAHKSVNSVTAKSVILTQYDIAMSLSRFTDAMH